MVKLFVVGFPRDMDESELIEIFGAHGVVEKALVITDADTGESKGYGFVDMQDLAGANAAVAALDGAAIDERVISVRIKEEKEPAKKIFSTTQKRMNRPQAKKIPVFEKKKRPRL